MNYRLPKGFYAAALHAGIKKTGLDLTCLVGDTPWQAAGVFTQNAWAAAPVHYTKHLLSHGSMQAVLVNSGNANAGTGHAGEEDLYALVAAFSKSVGVPLDQIGMCSTGVIGQRLPVPAMQAAMPHLAKSLTVEAEPFANAILTTDTTQKMVEREIALSGGTIKILGMAKGSGMIHPNMATMLAFVLTDADVPASLLQKVLQAATTCSFNQLSVDGDQSTNDTCLLLASGASGVSVLTADETLFKAAVTEVMVDLAKMIAIDGEGATKLLICRIQGALDDVQARRAAKSIITSSLVKTAVFGGDANWGRIIAALGNADVGFAEERLSLRVGDVLLYANGQIADYREEDATVAFAQKEIVISLDLGLGTGSGAAFGCDLSYDYVRINGSYRT